MINKTTSLNLKGLSIVLVILGHLVTSRVLKIDLEFRYFATFSVSIFLILSGYGLTKSYLINGLKSYIPNRIKTVYIPFLLANIIIYSLGGYRNQDIITLIRTITFNQFNLKMDYTMWYIYFIAIWYIFFFFIFSINISTKIKSIILFIIGIALIQIPPSTAMKTISFQFSLHALSFPIGVALALQSDKDHKKTLAVMSLSFTTFLIFYSQLWDKYSFTKYSIAIISFALSAIFIFKIFEINNKILTFLGKYSYEAYLLEGVLYWRTYNDNPLINIPAVFMVIFLSAIVLQKLTKFVLSKVNIVSIFKY